MGLNCKRAIFALNTNTLNLSLQQISVQIGFEFKKSAILSSYPCT